MSVRPQTDPTELVKSAEDDLSAIAGRKARTPDETYMTFSMELDATGPGLNRYALGFLAKTITVHNPSGQWFRLDPMGLWLPPNVVNLRIPVAEGTQILTITAVTPVGQVSNPQAGQRLLVEADSRQLEPSGGLVNNVGISANGTPTVSAQPYILSDNGWQQVSGNTSVTPLTSAARTATTVSGTNANYSGRGVLVFLVVTAAPATPGAGSGLTLAIQGQDPVSGNWVSLNANPVAVTVAGTYAYELYPGIGAASGGVVQRTSGTLPKLWCVQVIHGNADSYTYSVGASVEM